ncbi:N-glycosylase/DNA lyase [Neodiprion lecontei]|uniref:N-glycosylase/DNA lyase n=1 Tax=Neodiprion lecontei TaxID=441921 RepID=A0A6J0CDN1_NEOLC|nr:N-glycosylase/DNA lyase [Neodiprion lecontei]
MINKLGKMSRVINTVPGSTMHNISFSESELGLGLTLTGGQSFRWVEVDGAQTFRGIFAGRVWTLKQNKTHLQYRVHGPLESDPKNRQILSRYLRKEISLKHNVRKWSAVDPHFKKAWETVKGVRILNQDIVENLFAFICSSNNNIIRISGMVDKLCRFFGKKLCCIDDKQYYDFPTIESLAEKNVEMILKEAGFGYRAGYIANTAKRLIELGGETWLKQLHKDTDQSYPIAREKLITLPGIGPKVADCICLMSLGYLEAIPVDTHIFQVARACYMPQLETQKTVTPKIHNEVSTFLRNLWGPLAGWAQAVVFCAKLNNNDLALSKKKRGSSNKAVNGKMVKKLKKSVVRSKE